jgi:choice-of-anchor C domain-containing protein
MKRIFFATLTAGLVGSIATPAVATGPVFRDGLEKRVANATFERIASGSAIGPWTVTKGDVDLSRNTMWQVAEGTQSLDLDGGQPGAVATSIRSLPGKRYRITYQLAGNPADPLGTKRKIKTGELRANGKLVQSFSFDTTGKSFKNMGFVPRTAYVVSTGTSLQLEFASTMPRAAAGWGPVIDDVRVSLG